MTYTNYIYILKIPKKDTEKNGEGAHPVDHWTT